MPFRNSATVIALAAAFVAAHGASSIARADHQPVIVVPGRLDAPVIIDGVDARGAVVVGDWGLYRPGFAPVVEPGLPWIASPWPVRRYFPAGTRPPRYGRLEVEPRPGRRLPAPAQSFYRSWLSEPSPVAAYPPDDSPSVIGAPRVNRLKARGPALPTH